MNPTRAFKLFWISILSLLHRLHHDLAREIVVAVCAVVVLATFGYIFNDFLNVKVAELSPAMRSAFADYVAYFLMLLAVFMGIKLTRSEISNPLSLKTVAQRLGETPQTIRWFLLLRVVSVLTGVFGLTWVLIFRFLNPWTLSNAIVLQVCCLATIGLAQLLPHQRRENTHVYRAIIGPEWRQSRIWTLYRWRLIQILQRNRLTQLCIGIAFILVTASGVIGWYDAPEITASFGCMVGGIFGAQSLAFQLQEDLNTAWAERCMGISHEDIVGAYNLLGLVLGLTLGVIPAAFWGVSHADFDGLSQAAKALVVTWVPFFCAPSLMFQIDGRRPAIQAVTITLLSIFISTAILASWFSLIILPVFRYYTAGVQHGRFYRA